LGVCGGEVSLPHPNTRFVQLFPFLSFFFFPISSYVNLCVCVCVCVCVCCHCRHLIFLKQITSGLVFLQTQAPGEGTRQTQTCDRQAVRPRAAGLQTPTLSGETRRSSETRGRSPSSAGHPDPGGPTLCHPPPLGVSKVRSRKGLACLKRAQALDLTAT
jgi:hypothetical protein